MAAKEISELRGLLKELTQVVSDVKEKQVEIELRLDLYLKLVKDFRSKEIIFPSNPLSPIFAPTFRPTSYFFSSNDVSGSFVVTKCTRRPNESSIFVLSVRGIAGKNLAGEKVEIFDTLNNSKGTVGVVDENGLFGGLGARITETFDYDDTVIIRIGPDVARCKVDI